MKYHIYNKEGDPLFWDDELLEFDTESSAMWFLKSAKNLSDHLEDFWTGATIKEGALSYNGSYLNATNLVIEWHNGVELVEVIGA